MAREAHMIARQFLSVFILAAAIVAFAAPARADRCDDLAKMLADQITGLKVARRAAARLR